MNVQAHPLFRLFVHVTLIFMFCLLSLPAACAASDRQTIEDRLSDYLKTHQETAAGVAVIVFNDGELTYLTDGFADRNRKILIDEDTIFEWGSVSKILVWISVLQLAEAGRLDLDEDIATYLPEDFRSETSYDKPVTLEHLMNHTAGYDDSYTDLMVLNPPEVKSLREVLEAADVRQVFPPGQVVAYSNYGAGLAAYIVEHVSGMDYREYVETHIFQPLQMTKTAIEPEQDDHHWVKKQRKNVQGYTEDLQLIEQNRYVIPMYPAGSVMGIAPDLQKLMLALLSEDGAPLFRYRHTADSLLEPTLYYPGTDIPRIANGLFFLPSASGQVFGHGGNTFAFSSSFYVDRQADTGVVVVTNMAGESTFTLGIPEIIFGDYKHKEGHRALEASSKWAGIYEPARMPRHGFSKVYGLFLRSEAEPSSAHELTMNDLRYSQAEPGIYLTEDDFSAYALDVYSEHWGNGKTLSSAQTDLFRIPLYQHLLEWGAIVLGVLAALLSFCFVLFSMVRRVRKNSFLLAQHSLNLLVVLNIIWVGYQTGSMTTYRSIQPFLTANLFYMAGSLIISGILIFQMRFNPISKRDRLASILTVMTALIVTGNILYWEFYF